MTDEPISAIVPSVLTSQEPEPPLAIEPNGKPSNALPYGTSLNNDGRPPQKTQRPTVNEDVFPDGTNYRPTQRHEVQSATREEQSIVPTETTPSRESMSAEVAEPGEESRHTAQAWTPTSLKQETTLSFSVFYALFVVALGIVLSVDKSHQGVVTTTDTLHYLWTYGPTLVVSLIATFWDIVDYRTRQLLPWSILRAGMSSADHTLCLDYVSTADLVVFWRSAKNRHLPVLSTTASSWLIKFLVVLSTGLLTLRGEVKIHNEVSLLSRDDFDNAAWARSGNLSMPALFAYSLASSTIPYPPGTGENITIPTIDLSAQDVPADATVQVSLDAFSSNLVCEHGNISMYPSIRCSNNGYCKDTLPKVKVTSQSCRGEKQDWPLQWSGSWMGAGNYLYGTAFPTTCNDTSGKTVSKYIISTGAFWHNESITTLVCHAENTFGPVNVALDNAGRILQVQWPGNTKSAEDTPLGPSSWDMLRRVHDTIYATGSADGSLFEGVWRPSNDTLHERTPNGMELNLENYNDTFQLGFSYYFDLYLATFKPKTAQDFLDPRALEQNSQWLYSVIAAQIAKENLISAGPKQFKGTLKATELRLRVQKVALYWMIGIVSLILLLTVLVAFIAPRRVTDIDPTTIAGQADVLAQSQEFENVLSNSGACSVKELQHILRGHECYSTMNKESKQPRFTLAVNLPTEGDSKLQKKATANTWWSPWILSAWTKTAAITILIGLTVALDVLYRNSKSSQGIANVSNTTSTTTYAWRYVPGALMLLVKVVVGMMAVESKVFLPYHQLRHWPSTSTRSIVLNEMSRVPVATLYRAVRKRHLSIIAITLAVIAAFPLTIVSSGLYVSQTFNSTNHVQSSVKSVIRFDSDSNSTLQPQDVSSTGVEVSMMINRGLSTPRWTYRDLVFPELEPHLDDYGPLPTNSKSTLSLNVPAWRSTLSCCVAPSGQVNVSQFHKISDQIGDDQLIVQFRLPQECGYQESLSDHWPVAFPFHNDVEEGVPFYGTVVLPYEGADLPYIVHIYGETPKGNDTWSSDMSVVSCRAGIERLNVSIMIEVPSMAIITAIPNEASLHVLQNNYDEDGIQMWKPQIFEALIEVVSRLWPHDSNNVSSLTPFLSAVLAQNPTFTAGDLTQKEHAPVLTAAMETTWRSIYPYVANRIARSPRLDNDSFVSSSITGEFTQLNKSRITQNEVSTRILQVLLSIIAVCVSISFWSMNVREVLPKNPASIAAQMSLLAGSEMVDNLRKDPEWSKDDKSNRNGIFGDKTFSMGWWEDGESARFGIDVGRARWSR